MINRARCVCLLVAFAFAAFASTSALATDVNVTNTSGFGTLVDTLSPDTTLSVSGDFTATLSETVYLSGSTYTYVFTLANSASSASALTSASTATLGNLDNFSSALDYGDVTGSTTGGDASGFSFNGTSLAVTLTSTLPAGDQSTFYAQSTLAPGAGTFSTEDGGQSNSGASLDPTASEPSSILLLGLVMLGGLLYERKKVFA